MIARRHLSTTVTDPVAAASTSTILVIGGDGFVGRAVTSVLLGRGHRVIVGTHTPSWGARPEGCLQVRADVTAFAEGDWTPVLDGVDAVVHVTGALRGDLHALQVEGPSRLFRACGRAGVARMVHVSAMGAGSRPGSPFLATKAVADDVALSLAADGRPGWHVLRPSMVVGRGGASTALFCSLVAVPFPLRLARGTWELQPVHVDDVASLVAFLVTSEDASPSLVEVAGPEVMTTDRLTATLRDWMGLRPARPVSLPRWCLSVAASVGAFLPVAALTPETLSLMESGNVASGTVPLGTGRPLAVALASTPAIRADLLSARLVPLAPVVTACLAAVWTGSGIASALVPHAESARLLSGLGVGPSAAWMVSAVGAALDVLLGLAVLVPRLRVRALAAQLAVMTVYTVLATFALPSLWGDPFGSLLKNLAVLAATLALLALES